jgi:hypothetical protein
MGGPRDFIWGKKHSFVIKKQCKNCCLWGIFTGGSPYIIQEMCLLLNRFINCIETLL